MQLLDDKGNIISFDKNTVHRVAASLQPEKEKTGELPEYPKSFKEWSLAARPMIEGRPNIIAYLPFMQRYMEDRHISKQTLFPRQTGKSTTIASEMACDTTTVPGFHANYTTYEDESLSTFSNIKFRQAVWNTPPLRMFVVGGTLGEVGRIMLKNGSVNTLVTHAHKWKHLEGKSIDANYLDEAQYLDWDNFVRAKETQSFTQGKERIYGIGGYVNTSYERMWLNTDQREWVHHKNLWRDGLEFNSEGFVWGEYLLDLLEGHWEAKQPDNYFRHGYHMTQQMFPHIPLTIDDAISKYRTSPEFSIEWKQQNYPSVEFAQHVEAKFVEGDIKPITDSMMFRLYDRTISYTEPSDVDRSLGDVFIGVDWGGTNKTVPWVFQMQKDRMVLLKVEFIPTSNPDEQRQIVANYITDYNPKQVVVDAGGGSHQVQELQKQFGPLVRSNSYDISPESPLPTKTQLKTLRKENRYRIDKTFSLERIVNLINKQMIVIPAATDADRKISDQIVQQFTNEEVEIAKYKGTTYRRYFCPTGRNDDALQACNYAYIAYDLGKDDEMWFFSA